jgi:hypothetical protein
VTFGVIPTLLRLRENWTIGQALRAWQARRS